MCNTMKSISIWCLSRYLPPVSVVPLPHYGSTSLIQKNVPPGGSTSGVRQGHSYSVHPEKLRQIVKLNDAHVLCGYLTSDKYIEKIEEYMNKQLEDKQVQGEKVLYEHVIDCAQPNPAEKKKVVSLPSQLDQLSSSLVSTNRRSTKKKPVKTTVIKLILEQKNSTQTPAHAVPIVIDRGKKKVRKHMRKRTTILPLFLKKIKSKRYEEDLEYYGRCINTGKNASRCSKGTYKTNIGDKSRRSSVSKAGTLSRSLTTLPRRGKGKDQSRSTISLPEKLSKQRTMAYDTQTLIGTDASLERLSVGSRQPVEGSTKKRKCPKIKEQVMSTYGSVKMRMIDFDQQSIRNYTSSVKDFVAPIKLNRNLRDNARIRESLIAETQSTHSIKIPFRISAKDVRKDKTEPVYLNPNADDTDVLYSKVTSVGTPKNTPQEVEDNGQPRAGTTSTEKRITHKTFSKLRHLRNSNLLSYAQTA